MNDYIIELKNILCPIDFSDYSYNALRYAVILAEQFNSKIHVIHILPILPFSHVPYHYHDDILVIEEKAKLSAEEELIKISNEKIPSNLQKCTQLIKDNNPFVGITNYAKENNIDLIVISTHGYGGLKHTLFGSTAERVVRKSSCPVLTIKHPEHEFIG
ncbi:MAG: universal stress protein [Spirochaetota bacterium]|nr:universal stress protein [Spirochaetota bacterium]